MSTINYILDFQECVILIKIHYSYHLKQNMYSYEQF